MNRDAGEVVALYSRVLQIPVCVLLLVPLPPRNQLCLMDFLIVCPEFERRLQRKIPAKPLFCKWQVETRDVVFVFLLKSHYETHWRLFCSRLWRFSYVSSEQQQQCSELLIHRGHGRLLRHTAKNCWVLVQHKCVCARACARMCLCVSLRLQATMACPPCAQLKNALKSF